mmetsp:Transcript_63144/g.203558  ORF Transcript_63144/g.203558 Transcript_63144/m.203558 type:complete len:246 (+) Transcript_63144:712-1449(+)
MVFSAYLRPSTLLRTTVTSPQAPSPMTSPSWKSSATLASSSMGCKRPLSGAAMAARMRAKAMAPVSGTPRRCSTDACAARPTAAAMRAVALAPRCAANAMAAQPLGAARSAGARASMKVRMPSETSPKASTACCASTKASTTPGHQEEQLPRDLAALPKKTEKRADSAPSAPRSSCERQQQRGAGSSSGSSRCAALTSRAACARFRPQSPFSTTASSMLRSRSAATKTSQAREMSCEMVSFCVGG